MLSIDQVGQTPLHIAVGIQSKSLVSMLIAANADINNQDLNGHTPLHIAAMNNDLQILKVL